MNLCVLDLNYYTTAIPNLTSATLLAYVNSWLSQQIRETNFPSGCLERRAMCWLAM
jgi:hypothetical protein